MIYINIKISSKPRYPFVVSVRSIGHSSADMIMRYSKPTEEDKLQAVEGLYKD